MDTILLLGLGFLAFQYFKSQQTQQQQQQPSVMDQVNAGPVFDIGYDLYTIMPVPITSEFEDVIPEQKTPVSEVIMPEVDYFLPDAVGISMQISELEQKLDEIQQEKGPSVIFASQTEEEKEIRQEIANLQNKIDRSQAGLVDPSTLNWGPYLDRSPNDIGLDTYIDRIPDMEDPWYSNAVSALTTQYYNGMTIGELEHKAMAIVAGHYRVYCQVKGIPFPEPWASMVDPRFSNPPLLAKLGRDDTVLGRNFGTTVYLFPGDQIPENAIEIMYEPAYWYFDILGDQPFYLKPSELTESDVALIRSVGIII